MRSRPSRGLGGSPKWRGVQVPDALVGELAHALVVEVLDDAVDVGLVHGDVPLVVVDHHVAVVAHAAHGGGLEVGDGEAAQVPDVPQPGVAHLRIGRGREGRARIPLPEALRLEVGADGGGVLGGPRQVGRQALVGGGEGGQDQEGGQQHARSGVEGTGSHGWAPWLGASWRRRTSSGHDRPKWWPCVDEFPASGHRARERCGARRHCRRYPAVPVISSPERRGQCL